MQVRFFTAVSNSESSNANDLHLAFGDDTPLASETVPTIYLFCISTDVGVAEIQETCSKYGFDYANESHSLLEVAAELYNSQHRAVRLFSEPFFGLIPASAGPTTSPSF
jgi:hypothetical protein